MAAASAPPRFRWPLAAVSAAAVALAGFGVWVLRNFDPNAANSPFMGCIFLEATGLYCPGCGTTRALHALVHGDLVGMVAMNPLLPALAVALPPIVLHGLGWQVPLPGAVMRTLNNPKLWLVLLTGYWIARNLPWWPFTWLAPG
ncbi:DUF2752 domain-containing protein [Marilutibacter chinensis]|uniref:DUF2752 domain-containing protein n=1 Tax=Marilutibacter chinensis TaxID=2912247 RepID=A0ABS9HY52_9GAMM|nr:DUF2752 domain-containing protein [Lysobacter chinensis]MCF7223302.1 DUF2752 domain-containing protein [Lysobacter chinensis]